MMTLQACLGASKKQLGADRFGDVVKTGSASALAAVTLWNQVPVLPHAVVRAFPFHFGAVMPGLLAGGASLTEQRNLTEESALSMRRLSAHGRICKYKMCHSAHDVYECALCSSPQSACRR